jgi:hypothetical protein
LPLILFATEVASHQGTHTYRLFKLLKITRCAVSLNSSAAEKRDYEALPTSRQALFRSTPSLYFLSPTAGKPRRCRRGAHYIDTNQTVNCYFENTF